MGLAKRYNLTTCRSNIFACPTRFSTRSKSKININHNTSSRGSGAAGADSRTHEAEIGEGAVEAQEEAGEGPVAATRVLDIMILPS